MKCIDRLASMGKPMDHEDIIDKVLQGLDYEVYKSVIDAVNARDTPISFTELHQKLITKEVVVANTPSPAQFPATVHATQYKKYYSKGQQTNPSSSGLLPTPRPSSLAKPQRTFLGKCQWCQVTGHALKKCTIFKSLFPNIEAPAPVYAKAGQMGQQSSSLPQAHMMQAFNSNTTSNGWLLDSGASHHVTNDLNNLSLHAPYDGSDEIVIGDGSSLSIANTGSFSLTTPSKFFTFSNVLYVPSISRNILSISKFCKENNTSIEFLPSFFSCQGAVEGYNSSTGAF